MFVGVLLEDGRDTGAGAGAMILGMLWVVSFLTVQGYLLATSGQSVAKRLLGLRIVDADGNPPGFSRTVIRREGSRLLLGAVPYVGPLLSLADSLAIYADDRRTLHDHLAGTWVVRARAGSGGADDLQFPFT